MKNPTDDDSEHDPETGEVRETPRRADLTDDARAERDRARAERDELHRAEVAALRGVDPACEVEGDPPVVWRAPKRMGGEPTGVLLDLPRPSGTSKPGSRLVLAARSCDGAGPNGGHAHDYVTAFVRFLDGGCNPRRTVGVKICRSELREVAGAMLAEADRLDARDAASGDDAGQSP